MRTIGHYLNGANVAGTSGRFGDIYNPATGEVQAKVAFASRAEMRKAVENAQKAFGEWSAVNPQRRARVMFDFKALVEKNMDELALMLSSEHGKVIADSQGRHPARPRGDRVRLRHPASDEGRIHRRRRPRHRRLFDAPAARRRRRHHAVQLPGHDPDVDVRRGHRLRQHLHLQAEREGPVACRCALPN